MTQYLAPTKPTEDDKPQVYLPREIQHWFDARGQSAYFLMWVSNKLPEGWNEAKFHLVTGIPMQINGDEVRSVTVSSPAFSNEVHFRYEQLSEVHGAWSYTFDTDKRTGWKPVIETEEDNADGNG